MHQQSLAKCWLCLALHCFVFDLIREHSKFIFFFFFPLLCGPVGTVQCRGVWVTLGLYLKQVLTLFFFFFFPYERTFWISVMSSVLSYLNHNFRHCFLSDMPVEKEFSWRIPTTSLKMLQYLVHLNCLGRL